MGEGAQTLVAADRCYEDSIERAIEAHDDSLYDPVRAGIETAVEMAEADPQAARQILWKLQGDWETLERLQVRLGGKPERSALRIGAAIHRARAELSSPEPRLRDLVPELLEILGCDG
jgi:hypothetical protein